MAVLEVNLKMFPEIAKPITRSLSHRSWLATRPPTSARPSPLRSTLTATSKPPKATTPSEQILKDINKEIQDVHADLLSVAQEIDLPSWRWAKPGDSGGHYTNAPLDVMEMDADKHLAHTDARDTVPEWLADNSVFLQRLELIVSEDAGGNEASWKTADDKMPLQCRRSLLNKFMPPVNSRLLRDLLVGKKQQQNQDPHREVLSESSSIEPDEESIGFQQPHRGSIELTGISSSLQKTSSPTRDKGTVDVQASNKNSHEPEPKVPSGPSPQPSNLLHNSKTETAQPCNQPQKPHTQPQTPKFPPLRMRIVSRHGSMQKSQALERRRSMPSLRPSKPARRHRRELPQLNEDGKPTTTRKEELRQRVLASLSQTNRHRDQLYEHGPSEPAKISPSLKHSAHVVVYATPTHDYVSTATSAGAVTGFAVLQRLGGSAAADSDGDAMWRKLVTWYAKQPAADAAERRLVPAGATRSLNENDAASLWSVPSGAPASEDLYLGKYRGGGGTDGSAGGQESESGECARGKLLLGEALGGVEAPRPLRLGEKAKARASMRQRVVRRVSRFF